MKLPGIDGIATLAELKRLKKNISVIMMAGTKSVDIAVKAVKLGAADYLKKLFNDNEVEEVIQKIIKTKEAEYQEMDTTKPEAFNLLGILYEMQNEVLEA